MVSKPIKSLFELVCIKFWPELVGDIYLGVGCLPNKKIGNASLATRADDEIRIALSCRVELGRQILFRPWLARLCELLCSADNLVTPAIVDAEIAGEFIEFCGRALDRF